MKIPPQVWCAVGVTGLAVLASMGPLLSGVPNHPIPQTEQTLPSALEGNGVIPASLVLDPVVAGAGQQRVRNPFNLRPELQRVTVAVPVPPPPPLELSPPPAIINAELLK